jgi:hypothetical protein
VTNSTGSADRRPTASFTLLDGIEAGLGPREVRSERIIIPSRGIRRPLDAREDLLSRAAPYTRLHESTSVSHLTASLLHGMPLPAWAQDTSQIDLARSGGSGERLGQPRRFEVRGHRLRLGAEDVMMLGGTRITTPERTWLDLCGIRQLTMDDVIVAGEHLVSEHQRGIHPRTAIVTLAQLRAYVGGKRRVPGLGRARIALELMAVGADSPQETRIRLMLERAGLPPFKPNCVVVDPWGKVLWVDLGNARYRVAIEYDGEHHLDPDQQLWDRSRNRRTVAAGWAQVILTREDLVRGEANIVSRVVAALTAQGWR